MRKIIALIFSVAITLIITFMPSFSYFSFERSKENPPKTVLTLWHADCVPGGKNSRGSFIKAAAVKFNEYNPNYYIVVTVYSEQELVNALAESTPDILSYGLGLGESVFPYLEKYGGKVSCSDEFISAMTYENSLYGAVWSYGGYFMVGSGNFLSFSEGVLSPLTSAYLSGHSVTITDTLPSLPSAYEKFDGKNSFIATNREVAKLLSRAERGKIESPQFVPLNAYTDLLNALSVCKNCKDIDLAENFISFMTSKEIQNKLTELRLFSPIKLKLYSVTPYSEYEKELGRLAIPNMFTPNGTLKNSDELAKKALSGDNISGDFIKRFYEIN